MKDNICAIIVTYNCEEDFIKTFKSVVNQVNKVVIVDNGSKIETINILKRIKQEYDIELILCSENIGIAAALNKGVKYSLLNGYDWVMTLDHDSILKEDMVSELLKAYYNIDLEKRENIVSIIPRHIEVGIDRERQDSKYIDKDIIYVDYGITSGNLVRSDAFEKIGFFEEKLFIDLVDYDFCFRLKQSNLNIIEVVNAILYHRIGENEERKFLFKKVTASNHSALRRYYMTRNRIYCWNKYKGVVDEAIEYDKKCALKETFKILLYEKQKFLKMKMIARGIKDARNDKYGVFKGK